VAQLTSTTSASAYARSARLLGAFTTLCGIALAILSATAITNVADGHVAAGLLTLGVVLVARWLLSSVVDEWSSSTSARIRQTWRARLVGHFQVPRGEGERSRADLALAVERASDAPTLTLLATSAQAGVVSLLVIFWAGGWLSTLVVVVLLVVAVPLYRRAGTRSATLAEEYNARRSMLESRQLELLHHAPELRALGAVSYGADEIAAISDSEHTIAMRAIRVALESSLVTEFLSGVSIGLVAMVVGFGLLGGRTTLERALVAVLVTSELFVHVRRYGTEFHRREDAASSLDLLSVQSSVVPANISDVLVSARDLVTEASAVAVDVSVGPGTQLLVSGPSGAGKTTLLHTLLGWRAAREGVIERGSASAGYVSVESVLLSGSLWDNLTLGADIDPTVVRYQLDVLGLRGARFDDLDTELLADGRGLSTGERVRIVLARCLLASPELLVLDDIAGVLDAPSRLEVAAALHEHPSLAIIEATVDTPLLASPTQRLVVGA
jgi:ABC-type transport system involved in cytochrome bd biosynthesis fused ATPase/permease subunit